MKKWLCLLLLPALSWASTFAKGTQYQACFTPGQPCTHEIAELIYHAKKSVEMQAYSFTSYKIAHALKYVNERGVKVRVILDKSNFYPGQYSMAKYLLKRHVPIWVDSKLHIAHNKVLIIDNDIVETGSFNYTNAAQHHNAENVLIIHSSALAKAYLKNWQSRLKESKRINHMISIKKPHYYH